jgi:hypothetical protein
MPNSHKKSGKKQRKGRSVAKAIPIFHPTFASKVVETKEDADGVILVQPVMVRDQAFVGSLLPKSLRVGQTYADTFSIVVATTRGTSDTSVFSANGLYDTDYSDVGSDHQPYGFDQMVGLYNHYNVGKASMRMTFTHDTSSTQGHLVGIVGSADNSSSVYGHLLAEMPGAKLATCAPRGPSVVINHHIDIGKWFGLTRSEVLTRKEMSGTSSANPAEQVFWKIFSCGTGTVSTVIECTLLISFDAIFYEPKPLSQS